jgi:hypothetical protein
MLWWYTCIYEALALFYRNALFFGANPGFLTRLFFLPPADAEQRDVGSVTG